MTSIAQPTITAIATSHLCGAFACAGSFAVFASAAYIESRAYLNRTQRQMLTYQRRLAVGRQSVPQALKGTSRLYLFLKGLHDRWPPRAPESGIGNLRRVQTTGIVQRRAERWSSLATPTLECYWESLAARWGTKPSQARGIDIGTDDSGGTVLPANLFS